MLLIPFAACFYFFIKYSKNQYPVSLNLHSTEKIKTNKKLTPAKKNIQMLL